MKSIANWLLFLSPFLIIQVGYQVASVTEMYELWFVFYAFRLIILTALLYFLFKKLRERVSVSLLLILSMYLAEFGVSFIAQTSIQPLSYSSWLWNGLYKTPINEQGYRDADWSDTNKTDLLFIGDSFTDGHGIEKVSNRFSNLVAARMNKSFMNLGVSGSSTKDQLITLRSTSIDAKTLILQYFVNDIEDSGFEEGVYPNVKSPGALSELLVTSSFVANRIYSVTGAEAREEAYMDFISRCLENQHILDDHLNDLQLMIDYAQETNMKLVIVIFPYLRDVSRTEQLLTIITEKLDSEGVDHINMAPYISSLSVSQRIVNKHDVHPSVLLNEITAQKLISFLNSESL